MSRHCYDQFWNQFVLSSEVKYLPPDWSVTPFKGWFLAVNPPLRVTPIRLREGVQVGLIVGDAILPEGTIARHEVVLPFLSEPSWERFLHGLGGRFATVVVTDGMARVDTDPMASFSVTYSVDEPIVASTSTLIQFALGTTPTEANIWDEYPENRLGEMQSFPGGITADPRIRRLLPNHSLDLHDAQQHRWWPKHRIPYCSTKNVSLHIDTIFSELHKSLAAICRESHVLMTLTAGRDTRMILAAATPELRDHMTFFSIWPTFPHAVPRVINDAGTAGELAKLCQRPHVLLPTIAPEEFSEDLRRTYLDRIGDAGHWRKGSEFWTACDEHFPCRDLALVMGFGGEVTTYPIGHPPAEHLSEVTPEHLVRHLRYIPKSPRMLKAMDWWLRGLPPRIDVDRLNDLLWLENALACLSLTHLHGVAAFRTVNIPFSQRRLIEAAYQIPPELRRGMLVSREMFARSDLPLASIWNNGRPN